MEGCPIDDEIQIDDSGVCTEIVYRLLKEEERGLFVGGFPQESMLQQQ